MEDKSQKSSACWSCLSSPPREDLLGEIPMGGNWEREPEGEAGRAAGLTLRGREREGRVVRRKHLGPQCSLERRQRLLGSPPASVPDRGGSGLPVLGWEQPVGSRPWGRGSTGLASTAAGALGHPGRSEVCQLKVNEISLKDETGNIIPGSLELWVSSGGPP